MKIIKLDLQKPSLYFQETQLEYIPATLLAIFMMANVICANAILVVLFHPVMHTLPCRFTHSLGTYIRPDPLDPLDPDDRVAHLIQVTMGKKVRNLC
jgi:hypothetical protein